MGGVGVGGVAVRGALVGLAVVLAGAGARAQEPDAGPQAAPATETRAAPAGRGDLARALRRFEAAWEVAREGLAPATRDAVCRDVNRATVAFFTARFDDGAVALAQATARLTGAPAAREAVGLRLAGALVEPDAEGLVTLEAEAFRPAGLDAGGPSALMLTLGGARLEATLPAAGGAAVRLRARVSLPPGAHPVALTIDGAPGPTRPLCVARDPARYRAVAVFAGAGGGAAARTQVPIFAATGTADFAAGRVRAFAEAARRAGAPITFDEREGLEHLLIVREAATAAFEHLDRHGLAVDAASPGGGGRAP